MAGISPVTVAVKIHDESVRLKLLKAAPAILANNRLLVTSMAETAAPTVVAQTPLGPAHFGYHGRDTVRVLVTSNGLRTTGQIRAAVQLYWREYGTRGRARRRGTMRLSAKEVKLSSAFLGGEGGEPATMTAHRAVGAVRRLISFYYGGMAKWWHL